MPKKAKAPTLNVAAAGKEAEKPTAVEPRVNGTNGGVLVA